MMRELEQQLSDGGHSAPRARALTIVRNFQGGQQHLTVAPAFDAKGPNFLLIEPPALKSAMCTSLKLHPQALDID